MMGVSGQTRNYIACPQIGLYSVGSIIPYMFVAERMCIVVYYPVKCFVYRLYRL